MIYDREHTIGHAFFTGLKDDPSCSKLADIFKRSVIPLLQEYFYEGYSKIQLILGDNEKSDDNYKFIRKNEDTKKEVFKGLIVLWLSLRIAIGRWLILSPKLH